MVYYLSTQREGEHESDERTKVRELREISRKKCLTNSKESVRINEFASRGRALSATVSP